MAGQSVIPIAFCAANAGSIWATDVPEWDTINNGKYNNTSIYEGKLRKVMEKLPFDPIKFKIPTLQIHGTADDIVAFPSSLRLWELLDKEGVKQDLIVAPDGQHCSFNSEYTGLFNDLFQQYLEKYFEGTNTILAHCVKLSKKDMEVIKKMNFSVAHCPISNLRLGCGISKVEEMRNMGINITLGTDGQGSGSNMDMFETMKFATLLQKGEFENPVAMPAYEVLKMATINGAKALKMEKDIGSIEVGKKADLIVLNLNKTVTTPINDIFADIIYNAKGTNVELTMIDGNVVYEES